MLVTKHHSIELGRGTAVLMSDAGLGQQYIHTDFGNASYAGIDCSTDEVSLSMMLITKDTKFRVQLKGTSEPTTVQLNKGDVLLFKGDLRHSGGENDTPEPNIRFFAYLPHRKQVPTWQNFEGNRNSCTYVSGKRVAIPKKISASTVKSENLSVVTLPTSPYFRMHSYQKCLYCSKSGRFYSFEADAFFAGVQTNESTDARDYGDVATFPVRRGCTHFPDHGDSYTWKGAQKWLTSMRKRCWICPHRKNTKRKKVEPEQQDKDEEQ